MASGFTSSTFDRVALIRTGLILAVATFNLFDLWYIWLPFWLFWRSLAFLLSLCVSDPIRRNVFESKRPGREIIMRSSLLLLARIDKDSVWNFFWFLYFILGNKNDFLQNYLEAWRKQYAQAAINPPLGSNGGPCSILMSYDNGPRLEIPCRWDMSDAEFITHIRSFYYLLRMKNGPFEFLSLKDLNVIEIVEITPNPTAVAAPKYLNLGRYGFHGGLVRFWLQPTELTGSAMVGGLIKDSVLATSRPPPMQAQPAACHLKALDMVSRWDTSVVGVVVAIPLLLSILFCVVWSVVAVIIYHADVNTSVQTGFTIGSYVVTAGALLIALVAFLDAQYTKF